MGSVWKHEDNWVHTTTIALDEEEENEEEEKVKAKDNNNNNIKNNDKNKQQHREQAVVIHVCEWYGIECAHVQRSATTDDVSEQVTKINLSQNQLQGTIPEELILGLKTDLIVLDLSYNQLWGSLPINALHVSATSHDYPYWQLQTLILHHNAMTGSIPITLAAASNLREIQLDHNHFTNAYEFRNFLNNNNNDNNDDTSKDSSNNIRMNYE